MSISHPKDLFKSTAYYYARFRPDYPDAFFDYVRKKFHLDGKGSLLDLGCGTGQLALPFANDFEEVVGMDMEEEMLKEGKKQANNVGVKNIKWIKGCSEDLITLSPKLGKFKLVSMGRSFHWMDQDKTLSALSNIVVAGGGIMIVSDGTGGKLPKKGWQKIIDKVIKKYLGEKRRAGSSFYNLSKKRFEDSVARSAFKEMKVKIFKYKRTWNINNIVGYLYSTSFCSPQVLGDKKVLFEKELRKTLLNINSNNKFVENVALQTIIAWKTIYEI